MKHVTIPAQWLQELIALCGPEDHELRERVMKSAAPAPAAVAVPELQDMLRELRVQISAITVQLPQSVDCSGVWMAHDKMSAALAATPAAAPVELPEHWGVCVGGRIWIGKTPEHVLKLAEQEGMNPTLLFTEQQVRALLATGGQAQADLSSVIAWLEGGCDPKHAAAELRLIAGKAAPQQADARDALDQSGWVSVDDALPEHAISEVLILQMYFEADGTARMHDKEDPALGHLYNIAKGHCHQDGPVPRWSGRSGDNFGLLFRGGWRVVAWRHIHPASNYVSHIAAIAAANGV